MSTPSRSIRLRALLAAGLVALNLAGARAADPVPEGWFVWPSVEPIDGSALDASGLNTARGEKLPRVSVRDGRFATPDQPHLRMWGANLTANDAFPVNAAEADLIARQLAKGGVNIARLHHLDNPWAVDSGGSIWPKDRPDHRELDPVQLDRLHRLIATLRDRGIYTNLNLKVSKTLVPADGFPASVTQVKDFQKRVDIYDRRMIELQKDYARRLLGTKNPYTGLAPAEDPAVAMIELNNENSLLGFWTRDLGRGLDKLPVEFRDGLRQQWNDWLSRHYAGDPELARAWAPAASAGNGSLIGPDAAWNLSVNANATATRQAGPDGTSQQIEVTRTTGIDWQVQSSTPGLNVVDGVVYTVEFQARADRPWKLGVGVGLDQNARPQESWRSFGLLESVEVGTEWKPVRLSFAAHSVAGAPAALSLNAGQSTGTIWIKDLRLVPDAPGAGLQSGQSLADRTVPIPTAPSTRQWADWIHFLADTERSFAEEMRAYLRDELHVLAPIVCSQIDYGGLTGMNREQSMEFIDAHAYWQHPDFGGSGAWDPENWTVRNSPQLAGLAERTFGEFGNLALVRVAGKPYTISEYDHPAPSEFACEMYPTMASFACRQDWDIIYPFCIGAYGARNPEGKITDFFDQLHHPAKWGQSPFAAAVFRLGLVPVAPAAAELRLGAPLWTEQPHADTLWRQLIPQGSLDFLNVRYAVSARPGETGAKASLARQAPPAAAPTPVTWVAQPQGRVYLIATDAAAAAVGFLGGGDVEAGALRVKTQRFGRDFGSVTALALDRAPLRDAARVLITVVARAGNQGTAWNETRTSLGKKWGHGPTIAEHVPASITLAGAADRRVFALAPNGSRTREISATRTADALTFAVGADDHTLHYEIVAR